eukprot:ANDGO_00419.mRNA.1 mitochondrial Outer envelope protein 64
MSSNGLSSVEEIVEQVVASSSAAAEDVFHDAVEQCDPEGSRALKEQGNEAHRCGDYESAVRLYTDALKLDVNAVLYSNRSASYLKLEKWQEAVSDAGSAIALDAHNVKAYFRRAEALGQLEDYQKALADLDKCEELGMISRDIDSRRAQWRKKQEEKQKEMMDQLKQLGNSLLGKFGLSTNNFQFEKNPGSEGYSVKFVNQGTAAAGSAPSR